MFQFPTSCRIVSLVHLKEILLRPDWLLQLHMNYEILAKKARYFKQDEKGVATMCKLMEDMRSEAAHAKVKEKAILMLKNGKISFDEVSVFFSELSDIGKRTILNGR